MSTRTHDIEISRTDGDRWVASDPETGATGEGGSAAMALIELGIELGLGDGGELTIEELLAEFDEEYEPRLSEAFARKVEARRKEYEQGRYSSLDEVRERLNG